MRGGTTQDVYNSLLLVQIVGAACFLFINWQLFSMRH
jgi:hypothetical protein